MSALKLYRTSWSCQNLSNLFLNVSTVSAQTTTSGRVFQSKTTLLAKLNFLSHNQLTVSCDICKINHLMLQSNQTAAWIYPMLVVLSCCCWKLHLQYAHLLFTVWLCDMWSICVLSLLGSDRAEDGAGLGWNFNVTWCACPGFNVTRCCTQCSWRGGRPTLPCCECAVCCVSRGILFL